MNCPSRTDDTLEHPAWNQNPPPLNADSTTRNDFNGIANRREHREHASSEGVLACADTLSAVNPGLVQRDIDPAVEKPAIGEVTSATSGLEPPRESSRSLCRNFKQHVTTFVSRVTQSIVKFARFVGPGFLIAVAYIDPGNYATDVSAGSEFRYALLFMVLVSNLFAIFLQSLCIKLGTVTGLNLAQNCREHLPRWLVAILYIFAEAAIIATDIAEVTGSAIALNLLFDIPLVAGCLITMADVLVTVLFYQPDGSMLGLRAFEFFVVALVMGVVICFCIQLSLIQSQSVGEVLRGYLPSAALVQSKGLYQSCGILGATVMPHSMFLGSGLVQPRLMRFDMAQGYVDSSMTMGSEDGEVKYRPSIHAIRGCLKYSIVELALSLFTFALFVNSAILIVAGASLYGMPGGNTADLFGVHDLLYHSIAPAAGTIFALALLLSGVSAGIVCTMAGQMVSEGMLNWTVKPWLRRLITRSVSIIPSVIIAGAVGRRGLGQALTASQVVLSVILPFVSAPLIYFTCLNRFMTVRTDAVRNGDDSGDAEVGMRNSWFVSVVAVLIWLIITVMNVALLVLIGLGKT